MLVSYHGSACTFCRWLISSTFISRICCNHFHIAGPTFIHLAVTKKQKICDFLFLEFCSDCASIHIEQILVELWCFVFCGLGGLIWLIRWCLMGLLVDP